MKLIAPAHWKDYELLDCGNFEKLERFGNVILIRPEPQAIWNRMWSLDEWQKLAHARFVRNAQKASWRSGSEENGGWTFFKKLPDNWFIHYSLQEEKLSFKLAFTSFGHIGVFPEQADNWEFIYRKIQGMNMSQPKVLNLFAYTGGASLAAKAAGADVTHLDAVKQVVNWAAENSKVSNLNDIRWLVEDAMKYVNREIKREKLYHGIILDPPAYGRGPNGEKWVLEEQLDQLLALCAKLLAPKNSFLVLNLYSMGLSSVTAENLAKQYFKYTEMEFGEFYLPSKSNIKLPLGLFLRLWN